MEKVLFHPCITKYIKFKSGQVAAAGFYPDANGVLNTDFDLCRVHETIKGAIDAGWLAMKGDKFSIVAIVYKEDVPVRSVLVGNVSAKGSFVPSSKYSEFSAYAIE